MRGTIAERVEAKTRRTDGCWEWTAARNALGYGTISVKRRSTLAHRVAWELTHGPVPDGLCVCHTCDNPGCVRPDHLWLGTREENNHDRSAKGRTHNFGKTHCEHGHEFTPENTYVYREGKARACLRCRSEGGARRFAEKSAKYPRLTFKRPSMSISGKAAWARRRALALVAA